MTKLVRERLAEVSGPVDHGEQYGPFQRQSLLAFIRKHWSTVEPGSFIEEEHVRFLCTHLEAVSDGKCSRLLINIPPGLSKSLLVCVFWPAWIWTWWPGCKFMFASYSHTLALRDAMKMRDIVDSSLYIAEHGSLRNPDAWAAGLFINAARGLRFSGPTGGQFTGQHADIQVVDDPIKPHDIITGEGGDATSDELRKNDVWWNTIMTTRLISQIESARVCVMQRLHDEDLSGVLIKQGGYTHVCLPMEYDPDHRCSTPFGEDWRTEPGELLAPLRFPEDGVTLLKKQLNIHAAAQLQQRPDLSKGNLFKLTFFTNRYRIVPANAIYMQSWDMRFMEDGSRGDFVVGQVWAYFEANYYLVHQVRDRWSFTETLAAVELLTQQFPRARLKLVENKANGPAIMNALKKKIAGFIPVEPMGTKVARAASTQPLWQANNVWLPEQADWLPEFITEHVRFPKARHDDQVDCATQALNYLHDHNAMDYINAMKQVRAHA